MKRLLLLMMLPALLPAPAGAATIGFDAAANQVIENEIFSVDIVGDGFPEVLIQGGGVNVGFDPAIVNLLSVEVDAATWNFASPTVDPRGVIDNSLGRVTDIVVNSFPGVGGPRFVVATLRLRAVGIGLSALTLTDSTLDNPWASDGAPLAVEYVPGEVDVSPIPLPAAVWLFGGAFLWLVALSRRRRATSS